MNEYMENVVGSTEGFDGCVHGLSSHQEGDKAQEESGKGKWYWVHHSECTPADLRLRGNTGIQGPLEVGQFGKGGVGELGFKYRLMVCND